MKKLLSVILTVAMIVSVMTGIVAVKAAGTLQIVIDSVEAEAGTEVQVVISITGNEKLSSLKLDIEHGDLVYVKNKWSIKPTDSVDPEVDLDDVTTMKDVNDNAETKTLTLNWASLNGVCETAEVTYATVTFKVPEGAANGTKYDLKGSAVQNNVFYLDDDQTAQSVPFAITNGSVTVPGEADPTDTFIRMSLDSLIIGGKESKAADSASMKKGNVITALGWVAFTDGLKEVYYTVNGEKFACEDNYRDRGDLVSAAVLEIFPDLENIYNGGAHAGFGTDAAAMKLTGTDSLDVGTYTITLVAVANGGFEKVIKTITLEVLSEDTPEPPPAPAFIHTFFDAGAVENNTLVNAGGWTGANYPILRLGYAVDGGEPVFEGVTITQLPDNDPVKQPGNAGQYGIRFSIYRDFKDDGLAAGNHTVVLIAELDDEAKTVLPLGNVVGNYPSNSFPITIEGDTPVDPDPAALHAKSFNTVWVDGTIICDVGDALGYLGENPITGDVQNIGVRGWAWIDNSTIAHCGYKLDGGEPVFSDAFLQDRPDVYAQDGATQATANGFHISAIDVSALASGNHIVKVVVKATDDTVIDVVEVPFSIQRPASLHSMSFNTVYADGALICDVGDALAYLEQNPLSGALKALVLRGWAWIDNSTIAQFGYKLDGGEPVFSDAFLQDRPDVYAQAGATQATANGFAINPVDVSALATGDHTITVVVKAADGNIVEVVTAPFSVERAVTPPASYELINVSYDELKYDDTQMCYDGVYKKLAELEDKSILNFEKGAVSNISMFGWVRLSENIEDIQGFGYSIDGGEVVTGDFVKDRAAELSGAGFPGGQGFLVTVPVADLEAGEHSIDVYVIAGDGTQIKVIKVKNDVEYQVGVTFTVTETVTEPDDTTEPDEPGEDNPGTSDVAVVALASLAAIALAGAFIGKKALKK